MSDRIPTHSLDPALIGPDFAPVRPRAAAPSPARRAAGMLLLTTVLWGLSFPLSKALAISQAAVLPGGSTWFFTATTLFVRFAIGAAVLALLARRTAGAITRRELSHGLGLGVFAAAALLLQLDGLNYTAASSSAFLTSCYCIIIPVFVAVQRRRRPPALVVASCGMVLAGLAILSGVDWHSLHLGRGEWETLACSGFFAAQILWLERPRFAKNRTFPVSAIMFATIAAIAAPVALATARGAGDLYLAAAGSWSIIASLSALTVICTVITFTMMNHWQRHVDATEAGLIYCAEPVFASALALFVPGWLALAGGLVYANETLTLRLVAGGALITLANVLIQMRPRAVTPIR